MRSKKTKYLNYSSSRLKHFFKCPLSMHLSRSNKAVFGKQTQAIMDHGNLFEGYVLGFKENQDEAELIGRKKAPTIDKIKGHADHVKPVFDGCEGEPYRFVTFDNDELKATFRGEYDYIGEINKEALEAVTCSPFPYEETRGIWDLKYTGNITRVWDWAFNKEDYLQSVFYTYMHYNLTGEVLPFYYLIVENQYEKPVVRCIRMDVTAQDWEWLEEIIIRTQGGFNTVAEPSNDACLGGRNGGSCWYLEHCKYGRALKGGFQDKSFSDLPSKL